MGWTVRWPDAVLLPILIVPLPAACADDLAGLRADLGRGDPATQRAVAQQLLDLGVDGVRVLAEAATDQTLPIEPRLEAHLAWLRGDAHAWVAALPPMPRFPDPLWMRPPNWPEPIVWDMVVGRTLQFATHAPPPTREIVVRLAEETLDANAYVRGSAALLLGLALGPSDARPGAIELLRSAARARHGSTRWLGDALTGRFRFQTAAGDVGSSAALDAMAALVAVTRDSTATVRQLAATALALACEVGPPPVAPVVSLLQDEEAAVQWTAVRALAEMAHASDAAVQALAGTLGHRVPRVRESARYALVAIGARSVPALVAMLGSSDDVVGTGAVDALVAIGEPATLAVDAVLARRPSTLVEQRAARVLVGLGAHATSALPRLVELAHGPATRQAALGAIGKMGAVAVPAVIDAFHASDSEDERMAFGALLTWLGPEGVAALVLELEAPSGRRLDAALCALTRARGELLAQAVPALLRFVEPPRTVSELRRAVRGAEDDLETPAERRRRLALSIIVNADAEGSARVLDAARRPDPWLRPRAAWALALEDVIWTRDETEPPSSVVGRLAHDSDERVRAAAAIMVGWSPSWLPPGEAAALLAERACDPSQLVRAATTEVLATSMEGLTVPASCVETLVRDLRGADQELAEMAVELLPLAGDAVLPWWREIVGIAGRWYEQASWTSSYEADEIALIAGELPAARALLVTATRDRDPLVRATSLRWLALTRVETDDLQGLVTRALEDPDARVRAAAVSVTTRAGEPEWRLDVARRGLRDVASEVRVAAASHPAWTSAPADETIEVMTAALRDADPAVREQAAWTLFRVPAPPGDMGETLERALHDISFEVRCAAAAVIARHAHAATAHAHELLATLRDGLGPHAPANCYSPGELGAALLPALREHVAAGPAWWPAAAHYLRDASLADDEVLGTWMAALRDRDVTVRRAAAGALERCMPQAASEADAIAAAVSDPDLLVRLTCVRALVAAGEPGDAALVGVLRDGREDARLEAALHLWQHGRHVEEALPVMGRAAFGGDALVRRRVMDAVGLGSTWGRPFDRAAWARRAADDLAGHWRAQRRALDHAEAWTPGPPWLPRCH